MQVAHAAMALCDATMMAGVALTEKLEVLLLAACLRIAASNEGGVVLEATTVAALVDFPGTYLTSPISHPTPSHISNRTSFEIQRCRIVVPLLSRDLHCDIVCIAFVAVQKSTSYGVSW